MSKLISAEKAKSGVLDFQPPKIQLGVPGTALQSYEEGRGPKGSDFRMSEVIRVQTGIDKIESMNIEEEVERKTLERIKEVQENAYQEAYQLGLDEGRKEAFNQTSVMIDQKLQILQQAVDSLTQIKAEMVIQNEKHLIELAFHMAERLAAHEISVEPEATVSIVRQAVSLAQSEENIVVQVSPEKLQFLETLKSETGRDYEFMKKVKFEPNEELVAGGCVVISNYGEIDSRIEERVKALWAALEESLPRLKDKVKVA